MNLFNLGTINWEDTQLLYHTLAHLNQESIVLCQPKQSYICLGLPQNPKDELDLHYCQKHKINYFRREIGGGIVLLDREQFFFNIILQRKNPIVPRLPQQFFKKFLQPTIQTLHDLGLNAQYQPQCDIIINGKKISGNGGGEIGECKVLAGNILLDFNYNEMANIIKAKPNQKATYFSLMKHNITTLTQELQNVPSHEEIAELFIQNLKKQFGNVTPTTVTSEIQQKMKELHHYYQSDNWLYQRGIKQNGRELKIREGTYIYQKTVQINKKTIELQFITDKNIITKITEISQHQLPTILMEQIKNTHIDTSYDKSNLDNTLNSIIKKDGGIVLA